MEAGVAYNCGAGAGQEAERNKRWWPAIFSIFLLQPGAQAQGMMPLTLEVGLLLC